MVLSSESWIPPSLLVSSSKRKMKKRESRYCSFRLRRKFIILPLAAFIFTTMLLGTRVRVTLDLPPYTEKYLTVPSISGFLVNAANISVGSFNLKDTIKEYHSYLITTEEETEETEETQEISDSEAKDYSVLPPSNEEESNMDEKFTNTKGLSSSEHPRKEEKDSDSLKNLEETEVLNDYRVPLINDTTFIAEMTNNIEGDPTFSSNIKDDKWKKNSDSTKNLEETIVSNQFDASPINVSTSFAAEMGDSTSKEGMSSNNIKDKQTYMEEKNSSSTRNLEETKVLDHIDDASTNISTSFVAGTDDTAKKPGTSSQNTGACNYGKGRWVADSKRPLYSGFKCKQWLSEMWACRLTQRTDFSYEGYRWQPQHCNLREFEPSTFFQRMRNKTIAFVGDSIGRQQFQSLLCMVTAGEWREDVEDVGKEFGLVKPLGAIRPDGVAYRFPKTNTTILFYWTSTLADLQPLNTSDHPSPHVAMHLDRPPTFLEQFIHRFNVLVLNTGHHWNRGKIKLHKWVLHVNEKPLEDGHLLAGIGNAKNFTLNSLVKWIDGRLVSQPELKVFFRTISPRHFRHGEWNSGGNCDNTIPLRGGSQVSEDESSDGLIASAVKGTRVQLLDITALSELRDEGHISRYSVKAKQGVNDCLHWCLPGIPDTWNEILFSML